MKTLLVLSALFVNASAFALECPVKSPDDNYLGKVAAAIKAADSCDDGADLAEACALGASGDVATTAAASEKCSLDFWTKLNDADRKTFTGLQAKCDAKYKNMQGTMYLSANAFCHLSVARLYSELYTPAE